MAESVNFVFLGGAEMASTLGKAGTRTDLTLYDKKESGTIRTWVVPNGFPERIQPLFQAINMAENVIFHIKSLDRFAGEQVVALDVACRSRGMLSHSPAVDRDALLRASRGTVVEGYDIVEPDEIRLRAAGIRPVSRNGGPRVVVDHAFEVRGVGTVVLGTVASGEISRHDILRILPSGLNVSVRSIQMHDDPVDAASSPARVGLAIKGAKSSEINRGDVLCGAGAEMAVSSEVRLDFAKTPYYKGDPSVNQMCLFSTGLQVVAGKFSSVDPVIVALDRPAAYDVGDRCALLKPDSQGIRIMGGGSTL